ncbi:MAG: hypothetical protein J2O49_06575 [Sciscionella sp.]|nr:hypothetical protein [Sciscionella sp.]
MTGQPISNPLDPSIVDTASNDNGCVTVRAGAAGAIESVELTNAALERGGAWLAGEILRTAAKASARATVRTRAALRRAGLPDRALDAIGLPEHREHTAEVESTTPNTWRVQ